MKNIEKASGGVVVGELGKEKFLAVLSAQHSVVEVLITTHLETEHHSIFLNFLLKILSKNVWCNLMKRQDGKDGFIVNQYTRLCDLHFKEGD